VNSLCSNYDCNAQTSGPQEDASKSLNLGVAAHITSAASGGPRYDPSLSPDQRSAAENGIWLCQNCAKLIDSDIEQFPVNILIAWKTLAEHKAKSSLGQPLKHNESVSEKKMRALKPWIGKTIAHVQINTGRAALVIGRVASEAGVKLFECNEFFLTIGVEGQNGYKRSISLENITISRNHKWNCIEIQEPRN
jgi:hypothetical protein